MESNLSIEYEIMLPHRDEDKPFSSKEFLKSCDLMIAEVSHPSTGLGIELGWADFLKVDIICIYKTGSKISNSIKTITDKFIEYNNSDEMIALLEKGIKSKL